eukprot:2263784-Amphidinium_carterae.1
MPFRQLTISRSISTDSSIQVDPICPQDVLVYKSIAQKRSQPTKVYKWRIVRVCSRSMPPSLLIWVQPRQPLSSLNMSLLEHGCARSSEDSTVKVSMRGHEPSGLKPVEPNLAAVGQEMPPNDHHQRPSLMSLSIYIWQFPFIVPARRLRGNLHLFWVHTHQFSDHSAPYFGLRTQPNLCLAPPFQLQLSLQKYCCQLPKATIPMTPRLLRALLLTTR